MRARGPLIHLCISFFYLVEAIVYPAGPRLSRRHFQCSKTPGSAEVVRGDHAIVSWLLFLLRNQPQEIGAGNFNMDRRSFVKTSCLGSASLWMQSLDPGARS